MLFLFSASFWGFWVSLDYDSFSILPQISLMSLDKFALMFSMLYWVVSKSLKANTNFFFVGALDPTIFLFT